MTNNTLPILLKNQSILLIGGGKVALQKASVLNDNNIDFKIISQEFCHDITLLSNNIVTKEFELNDIEDYYIIIDATGNHKVSDMLLEYKKSHDILLNVVDVPAICDFYFMALSKNAPLQIAVTSNGISPTVAKFFRDEFASQIPNDINLFMQELKEKRENGVIEIDKTEQKLLRQKSKVYLVGCGLGDTELLTIQAYKIIQSVDVVLYDHLISDEIMDIVPNTTKRIFVGKEKGFHSIKQEDINIKLIDLANQGLRVARLKSGDPFVFGRGAEELEALNNAGIITEVIAGISSSIAAPMYAGIPITARGKASGFSVVSAHLKGDRIHLDWIELLQKSNHTVVVLMGISKVREIVARALELGVEKSKPCAIVSNASRANQQVIKTTLGNLVNDSENALRPAILIFGEVVKYENS